MQAARLEVALRFRAGGWAAIDNDLLALAAPSAAAPGLSPPKLRPPDDWGDLRGEALYRAGRGAELAALAESGLTTPWLAVLRTPRSMTSSAR
jgi:hypothetical protein